MANEHSSSVHFMSLMRRFAELEDDYRSLLASTSDAILSEDKISVLQSIRSGLDELSLSKDSLSDSGEWLDAMCSINALSNAVNSALNSISANK